MAIRAAWPSVKTESVHRFTGRQRSRVEPGGGAREAEDGSCEAWSLAVSLHASRGAGGSNSTGSGNSHAFAGRNTICAKVGAPVCRRGVFGAEFVWSRPGVGPSPRLGRGFQGIPKSLKIRPKRPNLGCGRPYKDERFRASTKNVKKVLTPEEGAGRLCQISA